MSTALVIVDMQRDFQSGSLAVTGGQSFNNKIIAAGNNADFVAFTGDLHPPDHISFSNDPKFVDKSWPAHCVEGTPGSDIDDDLLDAFPNAPIFWKGTHQDVEEYSGFAGHSVDGVSLRRWLIDHQVSVVVVVGLALDFCVKATALNSVPDFHTVVLLDATRPVAYDSGVASIIELLHAGVEIGMTNTTIEA